MQTVPVEYGHEMFDWKKKVGAKTREAVPTRVTEAILVSPGNVNAYHIQEEDEQTLEVTGGQAIDTSVGSSDPEGSAEDQAPCLQSAPATNPELALVPCIGLESVRPKQHITYQVPAW